MFVCGVENGNQASTYLQIDVKEYKNPLMSHVRWGEW